MLGSQIDRLFAGLAVGQEQHTALKIDSDHRACRISLRRVPVSINSRIAAAANGSSFATRSFCAYLAFGPSAGEYGHPTVSPS